MSTTTFTSTPPIDENSDEGTWCGKCGEAMCFNVPRLGPDGGYVHKKTGKLNCHNEPDNKIPVMSTEPKFTPGTPALCPLGRHGKYVCPILDQNGKSVAVSHGATEEAALANAKFLAASPAYLESIRPKRP